MPPQFGEHQFADRLVLYAGQSTSIAIPFVGRPQPTAEWRRGDDPLPDARRFKVDTVKDLTSLNISKAQRKDGGQYKLTLGNKYGISVFVIDLVVLGESPPHQHRSVFHASAFVMFSSRFLTTATMRHGDISL